MKPVGDEEEAEEEPSDPCGGDQRESSWISADKDAAQRYETVLHLDGMMGREMGDGVQQVMRKHDNLNSTSMSRRWVCLVGNYAACRIIMPPDPMPLDILYIKF